MGSFAPLAKLGTKQTDFSTVDLNVNKYIGFFHFNYEIMRNHISPSLGDTFYDNLERFILSTTLQNKHGYSNKW